MQPNAWKNFKLLLTCRIPPHPQRQVSSVLVNPDNNTNNTNNPAFPRTNTKNFFNFRDKFLSQADYDHHGIINSLHQTPGYFYPNTLSLHSEPADGSFIEMGPPSNEFGGVVPLPLLARNNTLTEHNVRLSSQRGNAIISPMSPPVMRASQQLQQQQQQQPVRALSNAYDFFDEDYYESRGYSNSFSAQPGPSETRRSTWGIGKNSSMLSIGSVNELTKEEIDSVTNNTAGTSTTEDGTGTSRNSQYSASSLNERHLQQQQQQQQEEENQQNNDLENRNSNTSSNDVSGSLHSR
jgi:hypothetical protein